MSLINVHEIKTVWGNKIIELHHSDITQPESAQDCLLVSAFSGGYHPTPGTILGALYETFGIHLGNILLDSEIDIRTPFHTWISKELNIEGFNYRRIACIEMVGTTQTIETIFKNMLSLFMLCEAQNIKIISLAMPILGTGNQGLEPEKVLPSLLENTILALQKIPVLKKVLFIERGKEKALLLDNAMNTFLQRDESILKKIPENEISISVIAEMKSNLIRMQHYLRSGTIEEMIQCLDSKNSRIFELGILGRRLLERLVLDLLDRKKPREDLMKSIERLHEQKIASWMTSYMHIIRTFGNTVAHDQTENNKVPANLSEQDLINYLFCLNRILDFWLERKETNESLIS